jgi:hypothetical protein
MTEEKFRNLKDLLRMYIESNELDQLFKITNPKHLSNVWN